MSVLAPSVGVICPRHGVAAPAAGDASGPGRGLHRCTPACCRLRLVATAMADGALRSPDALRALADLFLAMHDAAAEEGELDADDPRKFGEHWGRLTAFATAAFALREVLRARGQWEG